MKQLNLTLLPIPIWQPHDAIPLNQLPSYLHPSLVAAAGRLEELTNFRKIEFQNNNKSIKPEKSADPDKKIKKITKIPKKVILIGNTHKIVVPEDGKIGSKNVHEWTIFVRSADMANNLTDCVESVVFKFHPNFFPTEVTVIDCSAI